ncbi:hypothetical protein GCM10009839_70440 [Catenulispora yoronensis]|uniref:Uncharacterized protein n=1 Tax=Catenulispora yoronensis TaxID=450799 RepID=A0ABN2V6N9_9ACTN
MAAASRFSRSRIRSESGAKNAEASPDWHEPRSCHPSFNSAIGGILAAVRADDERAGIGPTAPRIVVC